MSVAIENLEHQLEPNPGVADQVLNVSDSAVSMPELDSGTQMALVSFEDGDMRATYDGSDPAADNGHLIQEYGNRAWNPSVCGAVRLIRAGSEDAVVRISEFVYGRHNARRTGIRAAGFDGLFNDLKVACGIDPDLEDGTSEYEDAALCRHFNRALKRIWEHCYWPELTVCEERPVLEDDDGVLYVPRIASGFYNLGDVYRTNGRRGVSARNPRTSNHPGWLDWQKGPTGLIVDELAGDEVWVEYRIECPDMTRTAYDAATSYAAGDAVYWDSVGECYICLAATVGHSPADSSYWSLIEIPWIFRDVAADLAAARWLKANNRKGWGREEVNDAEAAILDLADAHGPGGETAKAVVS